MAGGYDRDDQNGLSCDSLPTTKRLVAYQQVGYKIILVGTDEGRTETSIMTNRLIGAAVSKSALSLD